MSTQQRTAHATGFNNDVQGTLPERGSYYVPEGGGAPGILSGPASGFTIAATLYNPSLQDSNDIWGDGTPPDDEFIVGCPGAANEGWYLTVDGGLTLAVPIGAGIPNVDVLVGDLIVVMSYIPDSALYGGIGNTLAVIALNEQINTVSAAAFAYTPGTTFSLLGTDPTPYGGPAGGCRHAQLGSFWMTEGQPTMPQLRDFMAASMKAGEVVPAAWAPARTAQNPDPETPSEPTGHHWSANDLDLSSGLGGTWVDRIGGVVLERVGTISGEERSLARDPFFPYPVQ